MRDGSEESGIVILRAGDDPTIYGRHGLRRITYDRPGYGESDRRAGRTVSDVVDDIVAITEALGIDRFAVSGGSGGGPHCLAVAALMGDRVVRCLAVSSPAPIDADDLDSYAGFTEGNAIEFEAAARGDAAIREIAQQERATSLARLREGRADFLTTLTRCRRQIRRRWSSTSRRSQTIS